VEDFLRLAGGYLAAREAEHNLLLGICSGIQAGLYDEAPYLAVGLDGDQVLGAAVRTPPWRLVLSEIDDPEALELILDDLAATPLPGVVGPKEHTARFAAGWSFRTGARAQLAISERIFRVDRVVLPRSPGGRGRIAAPTDRETLVRWQSEFEREALGEADPIDPERTIDRWLTTEGRDLWVWEAAGLVSMCGASRSTPTGARIGPVYTPPEYRRRGYASALTAATSQAQLDTGRRSCFLFTDLANPTANHIYESIGYEPVRDVDLYTFDPH
jgi:predicted GNAT family acetyltransferase